MKKRFKKVKRYLMIFIFSCTLFIGSFFFVDDAKAASVKTGYGTFVQGSYDWMYGEAESILANVAVSMIHVHIECNQVYSGTMIVTLSGLSNFADGGFYVEGAQINTTSYNQIQLKLTSSRYVDVYFLSSSSVNTSASVSVSVSFSGTITAYGNEAVHLNTIDTTVTNLRNLVTTLNNMIGDPNSGSTLMDYLADIRDTIDVHMSNLTADDDVSLYTMLYDYSYDMPYLYQILVTLENLGVTDYSTALLDIFNKLSSIDTQFSNIASVLNTINTRIQSMVTTMNNISTQISSNMHMNLNIPRWQWPAYRWVYDVSVQTGQYSAWTFQTSTGYAYRYSNANADRQFTPAKAFYLKAATPDKPVSRKFIIAFSTTASITPGVTYSWYNNVISGQLPSGWYIDQNYGYSVYRGGIYYNYFVIYGKYGPNHDDAAFEFEFNSQITIAPLYIGYLDDIPDEAYALIGLEKEDLYADQLDSINDLLEQINSGIASLANDQTTIDNSTTIINDFDTSIESINDIETNILTDIDLKFGAVNEIITDQGLNNTNPASLTNGVQLFDFYFSRLTYSWNSLKYPFYIIMILFVTLCLLG